MHPFPAAMMAQGAAAAAAAGLRPQDVFQVLLQPASQMQAAINALPFSPDLLIDKDRVAVGDWSWRDAGRGLATNTLASNTTAADAAWPGYSGTNNRVVTALAQRAKFYVRVPYTGDGTSGRQIPHGLGVAPGMVIIKKRSGASAAGWPVFHRSTSDQNYLLLNTNDAQASGVNVFGAQAQQTTSYFTLNGFSDLNQSGATYVAYLFAHDPDTTNGIIQCGSFTTDGSGNATVNLGWQPQWMLNKPTSVGNWAILDTNRGWGAGNDQYLLPNSSAAEASAEIGAPNSSGFTIANYGASITGVYIAIRAPF